MSSELTPREVEILDKLANGYRLFEIAPAIGASEQYTKNIMRKLRDKLGADSTIQAVAMAIRRKIIE